MRLALGIFGAILLVAGTGSHVQGSEFARPHSHLGVSNYAGRISAWIEIADLKLAGHQSIPLRMLFSVEPPTGTPVFGKFWWCPLAESTLVPLTEESFQLSTLGGGTVYLVKKKDGTLTSGDGTWSGEVKQEGSTQLVSPTGWTYTYRAGRIYEAVREAERYQWNYQGGQFRSITNAAGITIIGFEYAQGFPVRITTPKETFECTMQRIPVLAKTDVGVAVSGFEYSLESITAKNWERKFPVTLRPEGIYALDLLDASGPKTRYTWNARSGEIISEGSSTYRVTPRVDADPVVSRVDAAGGVESYDYDPKTGTSVQNLPDGREITRTYFLGGGPTQYKMRKVTLSSLGKEISSRQWSYDEKGRKIREITGDILKTWEYSPAGVLMIEEETKNEVLVSRKTFDDDGRLATHIRKEFELRYSYEGDRTVIQRLKDGKLQVARISDAAGGAAIEYFVQAGEDQLLARENSANLPLASPLELEKAKNVALRAIQRRVEKELKNEN